MKAIATALLLFGSLQALANQTVVFSHSAGNLHLELRIDGGQLEQETRTRAWLLFRLADSLIRQQGYAAQPVLIQLDPAPRWERRPAYALGYGRFWYQPPSQQAPAQAIGLRLLMQREDFDIRAALRLLLYGLTHRQDLQTHQTEQLEVDDFHSNAVNGLRPAHVPVLPRRLTAQVLRTPDATVDRLLRQRLFCYARRHEALDRLVYYYQRNAFHFFARSARFPLAGPAQQVPTGPDVLVVDNVRELVGRAADGYFVFTSDSSFYYLPPGLREARGPVRLPRRLHGFQRVLRYTPGRQQPGQVELTFVDGVSSTQPFFFEPARAPLVPQPDQTAAAQLLPPAAGFALLWLLLAGVGTLALGPMQRRS